jgi:hypothetical protein
MTPDEYFKHLSRKIDKAAKAAVGTMAVEGEKLIRNRIPSARPKTRRAVMHYIKKRGNGYRVTYGLRFVVRYRIADASAKSFQIFRQSFERNRTRIALLFRREFFQNLNEG